jgi:hypothetical protein
VEQPHAEDISDRFSHLSIDDIDERVLRRTFAGWRFAGVRHGWIPSDTRRMEAIVARLEPA